jgi:hypothetical protein
VLAELLCCTEKRFAKHIGPEEFVQCSAGLLKEPPQSAYDVPTGSLAFSSPQPLPTTTTHTAETKKKTSNLENYVDWSHRLRQLVANEILQVSIRLNPRQHRR